MRPKARIPRIGLTHEALESNLVSMLCLFWNYLVIMFQTKEQGLRPDYSVAFTTTDLSFSFLLMPPFLFLISATLL